MGFRVNTNVASLQAQTTSSRVNREREESFNKLASGSRITKAADDAAGLAISEKMNAEIRSSRQANRNANDGISLIQTAEGGLNETSSILIRLRELALQSASDTLGDSERAKVELEYQGLKDELERISRATEFNGRKLLNGSGPVLDFHVGTGSNSNDDRVSVNLSQMNSGVSSLGLAATSVASKAGAQQGLSSIDGAIQKVAGQRSVLGSLQNRLTSSSNNLMLYSENMSASKSRIKDVDFAEESATNARLSITGSANTMVMAQANTSGQVALKLLS